MKWKWEPLAAMVLLFLLGIWIVTAPQIRHKVRPGAELTPFVLGGLKADLECVCEPDAPAGRETYRLLYRDGSASRVYEKSDLPLIELLEPARFSKAVGAGDNWLFRLLKVSGWTGFLWVAIGFAGQALFFGRMLVQWIAAERHQQAIIPPSFWWLSFFGGVMLFVYFAWRQDLVGVLGQTSGVVIYARNLRLIGKTKRRDEEAARQQESPEPGPKEESPPAPPAPPAPPGA